MWNQARGVVTDAIRDFLDSWRSLALTDIAYKLVAFAVLTPATALLLRWLLSRTHTRVVADTDIAAFFFTTRAGVAALVLGGAIILAITALELACLMAIGLATARGIRLGPRGALVFGAAQALNVLRLTANVVLRVLAGLLPFALGIGLAYWLLPRRYDINYYLAERPPAFWVVAVGAGLIVAAFAALLVWTLARWALALPLVLFEGVHPRRALGESSRRSLGHRLRIMVLLVGWAVVALALAAATTPLVERVGRSMAPAFSGSLGPLLLFIAGIALLWAGVGLVVAIVNASSLALVIVRLYLTIGEPRAPRVPLADSPDQPGRLIRMPRSVIAGAAAVAILAVIGVALLTFLRTRANQPVLVIAHRGASAAAPENSLAAFRLAVEEGADFVELDVQESADGEVLVIHDKDLMKVAGSPVTIWESEAAQVRAVDIGNRVGPQFAGERVPTLAEALAVCKGRSRVIVELKSYGHDQKLEERVAAIVEAAGMENDCIFMSLDHHMVWKMKLLRPSWRVGVLVAKALGDLTTLQADFLAVESKIASAAFVRRAHRADKDVYVWTVNDPAWMLNAMGHGVDGLITDVPDVACRVVARRAALSDAQRILVALLVRLGARTESLKAEEALRP